MNNLKTKRNEKIRSIKRTSMSKNLIRSIVAGCVFFGATINSQAQGIFQLPNGGFERWYYETSDVKSLVPEGFNSFYTAAQDGSLTSLGVAQRCNKSADTRPGSLGDSSLLMYSTTVTIIIVSVRANGNVTSGRMRMGSSTADSPENYNSVVVGNSKYCQEITGTPDSLRFWVKYKPGKTGSDGGVNNVTDKGRMTATIHGTDNAINDAVRLFRDPTDVSNLNSWYGRAVGEMYQTNNQWVQITVPFEYLGNNTTTLPNGNRYLIMSMTTNSTPGGGANNPDSIWFDDVEFVYSACLTDLKIKGTSIPNFEKEILTYGGAALTGNPPYAFPYQASDFSWIPERNDIVSVAITNVDGENGDADGGYTSILVTAEDSVTTKEYRIYYFSTRSTNNNIDSLSYTLDGTTPILVQGFSPDTLTYNISLTDPEEVRIPQFRMEDIVLEDTLAKIYSITQPTGVNSTGEIVVQAENLMFKTYTVNFSKVKSTNSELAMITVGGVNLPNFDPDTLVYYYDVSACVTANSGIPTVAYSAASVWALVNYTSATTTTRTATIAVTAEDGITQTTYTVNFVFTNNNTSLLGYRAASTNQNNTLNNSAFAHAYSASFTSVPALSLSTTTTQQGCMAQQVLFPPAALTVFYPDTNYIKVTAQDGIATQIYKVVLKNTNCYVATGSNSGFRYNYNGLSNQNTGINITSTNNNNTNTVTTAVVTLPVGRNLPPELVVWDLATSVAPPAYIIKQPAHRNDTAVVTLTANDGTTQKIYRIPFKATLSTDATLKSVSYSGNTITSISPVGTTNYTNTIVLPSSTLTPPAITAIANFEWLDLQNIVITPAATLADTVVINVTAENGTTKSTYKFAFKSVNAADNAYLKSIKYNNTNIDIFNPEKYDYTINIPYSTAVAPVLSAVAMESSASIFYNQPTTSPYQGKILVYSANMQEMKIYTVNLIPTQNTDATLTDIKIDGVSLPNFNPQSTAYKVELPYTQMLAPVVAATPSPTATVTNITQLTGTTVAGTVTITVKPESGSNATYTIIFSRAKSPVKTIDTIKYQRDGENYVHKVSGSQTNISIKMPAETESVPLLSSIVLSDSRADYRIYEYPNADNNFTATIAVFAENLTQTTYFVQFENTLSSSTLLTDIFYDGTSIENFDPNTKQYTVYLPYNAQQAADVSVIPAWKNTQYSVVQSTEIFGYAEIFVTSEDGQNTDVYTVYFVQKGQVRLADLSYNLDGNNLPVTPTFDPAVLEYNITLPFGTTNIPVLQYTVAENDPRTEVSQNELATPNGTIYLTLITDYPADTLTYTVTFTMEAGDNNYLSDLLIDNKPMQGFDKNVYFYKLYYPYGTTQLPTVRATAEDPKAIVALTQAVHAGDTAKVEVTARNGDIALYQVFFEVGKSPNAHAKMIYVDWEPLEGFDSLSRNYYYTLPNDYRGIPFVTVELDDENATYEIINPTSLPAQTQIIITAEDGENEFSYRINFSKNTSIVSYNGGSIDIGVYPNPTTGALKIKNYELKDGDVMEIYNVVGQRVYTSPNPSKGGEAPLSPPEGGKTPSLLERAGGEVILDVSHLANGMYFYKIFSDKIMLGTGRFVKE